jgi:hypothetical protein
MDIITTEHYDAWTLEKTLRCYGSEVREKLVETLTSIEKLHRMENAIWELVQDVETGVICSQNAKNCIRHLADLFGYNLNTKTNTSY